MLEDGSEGWEDGVEEGRGEREGKIESKSRKVGNVADGLKEGGKSVADPVRRKSKDEEMVGMDAGPQASLGPSSAVVPISSYG